MRLDDEGESGNVEDRRGLRPVHIAGGGVGAVVLALIGYFVIPLNPEGWRIALVIVSVPVVVLLWWRRSLHESPRWLEIRGRHAEAEAVVSDIERQVERTGVTLSPVAPVAGTAASYEHSGSFFGNLKLLWKPPLAKTTLMTWCLWLSVTFCSYTFFVWIPGLLVQHGMTITKSFSVSIFIYLAQIPGYYSSAYFCEKLGRKTTIVTYMALACVAGIWLANAGSDTSIVLASIFMSFAMNRTLPSPMMANVPGLPLNSVQTNGRTGSDSGTPRIVLPPPANQADLISVGTWITTMVCSRPS